MAGAKKRLPELFDEDPDPVAVATGKPPIVPEKHSTVETIKEPNTDHIKPDAIKDEPKKKVGYYFPLSLADEFSQLFYRLKTEKFPVKNTSELMVAIVRYGLEDISKGQRSKILKSFD